jgi:large subunit ribosomal protein L18
VDVRRRLAKRRLSRARRVRRRVRGTADRPRVTLRRSHRHLWVQLVDDGAGRTLCAASTKGLGIDRGGNVAAAKAVGEEMARRATALGVKKACFDRGGYRYHGRVKAVADAIRAAGVEM